MAAEELGRTCVDFTDLLRRRGVAVGPAQTAAFLEALYLLRPTTTAELYWAGRAVLATDVAVLPAYARAFAEFFAAADADEAPPPAPPHAPPSVLDDEALARPAMDVAVGEEVLELPEEARVEASEAERVRVKSFARIHRANLINWGVVPLVFDESRVWDELERDDRLRLEDLRAALADGRRVRVSNLRSGRSFTASCVLTPRERDILLAGGVLAHTRASSGST